MCTVNTDVCGIKSLYNDCPPVRKIIHSLKLADYLHLHANNPCYNYYLTPPASSNFCSLLIIFANSLGPEQERLNVGPDPDLDRLTI